MKKGEYSNSKGDSKSQREFNSRTNDRPHQPPQDIIGEIKTIAGGPISGGSFRFLNKECQRQVNSVHMVPPFKHRRTDQDMSFNEADARGVKQPHNDQVIMLNIEGFNTKRILIDNGSSVDIIYLPAFQQLKLDPKRLCLFESPLISFNGLSHRHSDVDSNCGDLTKAVDPSTRISSSRLPFILQCNHWDIYTQ